jgi:hypothetical protein
VGGLVRDAGQRLAQYRQDGVEGMRLPELLELGGRVDHRWRVQIRIDERRERALPGLRDHRAWRCMGPATTEHLVIQRAEPA